MPGKVHGIYRNLDDAMLNLRQRGIQSIKIQKSNLRPFNFGPNFGSNPGPNSGTNPGLGTGVIINQFFKKNCPVLRLYFS